MVPSWSPPNGYSGEWEAVRSWDNGAFIAEETPRLSIRLGADINDDATNGLGNNFQQLEIPVEIRYGQTLVAPDDALEVTEYQLQELESALSDDIFKMYGSPYKISRGDVPEYCGTEYTGEGDLTPPVWEYIGEAKKREEFEARVSREEKLRFVRSYIAEKLPADEAFVAAARRGTSEVLPGIGMSCRDCPDSANADETIGTDLEE